MGYFALFLQPIYKEKIPLFNPANMTLCHILPMLEDLSIYIYIYIYIYREREREQDRETDGNIYVYTNPALLAGYDTIAILSYV